MKMNLLKRIWFRLYFALSFAISLAVWIVTGSTTSPEIGPLGRTRWRCACSMWRYSMSRADCRIGLAHSVGQALRERLGRTIYGEARRECHDELNALWVEGGGLDWEWVEEAAESTGGEE